MPSEPTPRIALIHALEESVLPARAAFAAHWPQARCFDLLDSSLAVDLADAGRLEEDMMQRFQDLAHYATRHPGKGGHTRAILFTCSAFGPAIDAVKARLPMPVLRPNEAAFEQALELGTTLGILVTFDPSRESLAAELQALAAARGRRVTVKTRVADGALAALKAGDTAAHDRLAAEASRDFGPVDALILGQFSLARAAEEVRRAVAVPVLTTPDCAVRALRNRLAQRGLESASRS